MTEMTMNDTISRELSAYRRLNRVADEIDYVVHLLDEIGMERLSDRLRKFPTVINECVEDIRSCSNDVMNEQLDHSRSMLGGLLALAMKLDEDEKLKNET